MSGIVLQSKIEVVDVVHSIVQHQETTKEIVEQILSTDQRARNDDLWLILQVWQTAQQIKIVVPFDEIKNMIAPETIRRVRQQIQNTEGLFLPTDAQVILRRQIKEDALHDYYRNQPQIIEEVHKRRYGIK